MSMKTLATLESFPISANCYLKIRLVRLTSSTSGPKTMVDVRIWRAATRGEFPTAKGVLFSITEVPTVRSALDRAKAQAATAWRSA